LKKEEKGKKKKRKESEAAAARPTRPPAANETLAFNKVCHANSSKGNRPGRHQITRAKGKEKRKKKGREEKGTLAQPEGNPQPEQLQHYLS